MINNNSHSKITPIVCVNYNSDDDCLEYANKHASTINPIIIIDNSPSISSRLQNAENKKTIFYYFINGNIGYLNALGIGIAHANHLFPNYRFIALSNVDLEFNPETLNSHLIKLGDKYTKEGVGIIGPSILSIQTGLEQNPFLRNRPRKWKIKYWLYIAFNSHIGIYHQLLSNIKNNILSCINNNKDKNLINASEDVYSVHGSFFILSRNFIDSMNSIKWPCFLFGEEIWFSEMARLGNYKTIFINNFSVIHKEHITTGLVKSKKRVEWHHQSMRYIYEKFFKSL